MVETSDDEVLTALARVVSDQGWPAPTGSRRVRAALNDVLGADADDHRADVDVLVVAVEEGIAEQIRREGRPGALVRRHELVQALEEWGLSTDRATWAVDAWVAQLPDSTMPPPDPDPRAEAHVTVAPTVAPTMAPAAQPTTLPPAPTADVPARTELPPLRRQSSVAPARARARLADRRVVAVGALVVALIAGGGVAAVWALGQDDGTGASSGERASADADQDGESTEEQPPPARGGELVPVTGTRPPAAPGAFTMAARTGGVRIANLGELDQVSVGEDARSAPEGGRLVAFRLTNWPCEADRCRQWSRLGLRVQVGNKVSPLPTPSKTDTFAVAVPAGVTDAQLVMRADGHRQTLSLMTGDPGPGNIEVLARPKRTVRLGEQFQVFEQTSEVVDYGGIRASRAARSVRVSTAELSYFTEHGKPSAPGRAFLKVRAEYTIAIGTYAGTPLAFELPVVSFVSDGKRYPARDLDPGTGVNAVFDVPADIRTGVFKVGGSYPVAGPDPYTVTVTSHEIPIRFT